MSNPFRPIQDTVQRTLKSIVYTRLIAAYRKYQRPIIQAHMPYCLHVKNNNTRFVLGSNSTSKYSDLLPGRKCLPGHSLVVSNSVNILIRKHRHRLVTNCRLFRLSYNQPRLGVLPINRSSSILGRIRAPSKVSVNL